VHIIDMYRNQGEGLNHYARVLKDKAEKNNWNYGDHYAPHDIQVRELGSGAQTRLEIAKELGVPFKIVPNIGIGEGIELARGIFPRLWVDTKNCNYFIKAAENYHKHYNERLNVYSEKPVHDWSSHTMDAFRYLSIMQNKRRNKGMTEAEAERLQGMYHFRY
jgi:phage terminase large subunit